MRPCCSIDAIFTFNLKDEHGAWIPTRITIGSWITLQPGREGGHARNAAERGSPSSFLGRLQSQGP